MSIEIRREGAVAFSVPLPRALFRDLRLTFGARGLFAFLWDLPVGWVFRLEHLVTMGPEGRDALRARLRELQQVGAVKIEVIRADAGRLAGKRWVLIAADRWAIEAPLRREPLPGKDLTEERVSPSSVMPIVRKSNTKVVQGFKVCKEAGASALAREPVRNAAASAIAHGKRWDERPSGIVTWTSVDVPTAEKIEQQHSTDEINAAVAALAVASKEPVPGLVRRELGRQRRAREAAESRAVADAAHLSRMAASPPADPAARKLGEQFLATLRRKRGEVAEVAEEVPHD